MFYVRPYLRKIPILTHIFQMGWNHQLDNHSAHPTSNRYSSSFFKSSPLPLSIKITCCCCFSWTRFSPCQCSQAPEKERLHCVSQKMDVLRVKRQGLSLDQNPLEIHLPGVLLAVKAWLPWWRWTFEMFRFEPGINISNSWHQLLKLATALRLQKGTWPFPAKKKQPFQLKICCASVQQLHGVPKAKDGVFGGGFWLCIDSQIAVCRCL